MYYEQLIFTLTTESSFFFSFGEDSVLLLLSLLLLLIICGYVAFRALLITASTAHCLCQLHFFPFLCSSSFVNFIHEHLHFFIDP